MIELPEAAVLSRQVARHLIDKEIGAVTVLHSPHKFAWFHGDPQEYPERLRGKRITGAEHHGGMVRIRLGETSLLFHDGPRLRYATEPSSLPKKHQLLLEFEDSSFLCASIQMYGGIICLEGEEWDNEYYRSAREKPSPLGDRFTGDYFRSLCEIPGFEKLSAKAFLATEQRVPGLGNGVLQDILFHAGIHPRRKMGTVPDRMLDGLLVSITGTLKKMAGAGGRDTEKDLFGNRGGYRTVLSRNTLGRPCPRCGSSIEKAAYAGGSVYFCRRCQPLDET